MKTKTQTVKWCWSTVHVAEWNRIRYAAWEFFFAKENVDDKQERDAKLPIFGD